MTSAAPAGWLLFAVAALGCCGTGRAAMTLTVRVSVVSEPCIINGGRPIAVDFGDDLLTSKVDGSRYMKNIDYSLECSDAVDGRLKMTISGVGAGFDSTVLQADQANLGIRLLHDGQPMPLNEPLSFSPQDKPALQAVPVKNPADKLRAGAFAASATLSVEYL